MPSRTCPTLLQRLRDASDPLAWGEFFQCYWTVIYSYARACGCSEHTAEEMVQEVMLTVFEQRDVFHYEPARGRFRDWLHRVTSNRVAQRRRRPAERLRSRENPACVAATEAVDDRPPPDAVWEAAFEKTLLAALVDVVRRESNPRDFVAFELTVLQERAPAEVARLLGITRNMVYKARRMLLGRLQELAGDYARDGQLGQRLRLAMVALPEPGVERAVSRAVETMRQPSR